MTGEIIDINTGKKPTVSNIKIYFKPGAVAGDVEYKDIIGYQVGGGALMVGTKDGQTYIWNFEDVRHVKFEVKEIE